jgi:hypothetical protein
MFTLFQGEGEAKECLRCKKIEAERALEQASNPQEVKYYDDYLSMNEEEKPKGSEKRSKEEKVENANNKSDYLKD